MRIKKSINVGHNIQMQDLIDYNFLIIGRSGAGKSATSKLLTGDPSITVANSLNQVTQSVNFYRGISHSIENEQVRFGILDIPGLDRIDNRFKLRQIILNELQRLKITLHGIVYIASLTQRDTVDKNKLFKFVQQLPWHREQKAASLIPILTKFDNLMIDSPQQEIQKTMHEFQTIFTENEYQLAWSKHIQWVNFTKSLEFKMKISQNIKQVYENQIENLVKMAKKNKKYPLTAKSLKQYIQIEQKYIIEQFLKQLYQNKIHTASIKKSHRISLHIKIQHQKKLSEGLTAVSASSIGLILSRALNKDIPVPISILMMGIPLSLAIFNLTTKQSHHVTDKISCQETSNHHVLNHYNRICQKINNQLENQWSQFNKNLQFFLQGSKLVCSINKNTLDSLNFFDFSDLGLFKVINRQLDQNEILANEKEQMVQKDQLNHESFTKSENEKYLKFTTKVPRQQTQKIWDPIIQVTYKIKTFDQTILIKQIEKYRLAFNLM